MGRFFAEKDWSRTALGAPQDWSAQLKGYVDMILRLPTPTILFWGEQQVQLYNLGYSEIMGPRHPRYLGEPYRDCWPDTFETIDPMMRKVLDEGEVIRVSDALIPVTRYGFNEETYFTFSFVPLRNAEGAIAGILQPITETTKTVIAERRLVTVRAMRPSVSGARDAITEAAEALTANARDIPFAALFVVQDGSGKLAAATQVGMPGGADAFLAIAGEVLTSGSSRVVADVTELLGGAALGPWPEPAKRAMVLPLQRSEGEPAQGVAVFGISSRLEFDAAYRSFFESAAQALASNLAFEAENREKTRLNLELARRAEALTELDRAKTAFFSNVSHEFRTPITLILGPIEELLTDAAGPLAPRVRERLEMVLRNSQRLQKLVNSLLDFARIEAGRAQASYQATDLPKLTAELASAFQSAVERGGLRFVVACEPLPHLVYVDHEMWEKVVLNLISNAFKFTFVGEIALTLSAVGDHVELEVRDTGVGIPDAEVPHLFERFHRVEETRARTHEGSGIGLALVAELVKLHGGSIRAASKVDVGTTFTVSLPFGSAHLPREHIRTSAGRPSPRLGPQPYVNEALRWLPDEEPERAQATPPVAAPGITPERGRILLADDNADMRSYVQRILADRWNVEVASNGRSALDALANSPPDLLLTDVMMPDIDGFELLRIIRENPETRDIPVIMLSARSGDEDRAVGLEAGANDYLVKPFAPRELLARVETQLIRALEARIEDKARKRLTRLFMLAPVGVALLRGPQHVYELANDAYRKLVGGRDVAGKAIRDALPELAGQGIYELLDSVRASGEPFVGKQLRVLIDRQGGGEPEDVYFTFIYQPMLAEDGQADGILVVVLDVTEQVVAHRRLEELKERERLARADAERANSAKDEFLAMLGHELRNPLAPIVTAISLMRLKGSPGIEKELNIVERQTTHLLSLVDDLLDISRITRGKIQLNRVHIELCQVVANALEIASPLLEQRHHRVHTQIANTGLTLYADVGRVNQVLSNLLTNAAKYTDPGGDISIRGWRDADEIVLAVSDTGVGISHEMLPRVFEIFTQEKQSNDRAQGGLGLGLAIVKNLVALHGGSVTATSAGRGRGSEFTVRLPAGLAVPAQVAQTPIAAPRPPAQQALRILVVDDNIDGAETLAQALAWKQALVRVVYDGPSALQAAREFAPDIAFLDIGLPVMDGYELARQLLLLPSCRHTKLVALTGYGQEDDRRKSREAGFVVHLTKPISSEQLYATLEELRKPQS